MELIFFSPLPVRNNSLFDIFIRVSHHCSGWMSKNTPGSDQMVIFRPGNKTTVDDFLHKSLGSVAFSPGEFRRFCRSANGPLIPSTQKKNCEKPEALQETCCSLHSASIHSYGAINAKLRWHFWASTDFVGFFLQSGSEWPYVDVSSSSFRCMFHVSSCCRPAKALVLAFTLAWAGSELSLHRGLIGV